MRWLSAAIGFCGAISAVLAQEVQDEENKANVTLLTNLSDGLLIGNVDELKVVYCQGVNIPQPLEWVSPTGDVLTGKSNANSRVYTEITKHKTLQKNLLSLFLKNLTLEDTGNWTCRAGDELSQTFMLYVGEKVNISVPDVAIVGDEEKSIKLVCDAKGYPEPVVQWYKNNQILEVDQTKYFLRKKGYRHTLEISNLNHMDPGTYTCRATQEKLSYFTQKNFHLNVRHKPVIMNEFTEREVYAIMNEIKNITCRAQANPLPKFSWAKRDKDHYDHLIPGDMVYMSEDGTYSVLMLKVYSDEDLGQYKCSVENDRGRVNIIFDVTLGNKPNPPTSVTAVNIQAYNITFNVTCQSCVFEVDEGVEPSPDNLTVLGYDFQLVPCREGIAVPYWENATQFPFLIKMPNETEFVVGPLMNATEYHARVATRNAAGLSDWLPIHPNPKTADDAAALTVSLTLLIMAFLTTYCY